MRYRWQVVTDEGVYYYDDDKSPYNSVAAKTKSLYEEGKKYEVIDHKAQYGEWFDFAYFRCKAYNV